MDCMQVLEPWLLRSQKQAFYWPTILQDSKDLVKKCDECQRFAPVSRQPSAEMTTIPSPWPLCQWGMDILGPFPKETRRRQFVLVVVDYFTKWVEVEALADITANKMISFLWKNMICRFRVPRILITDNGTQFDNQKMREQCERLQIDHRFSSVSHPQTNGQVELTNRVLLNCLKKKIKDAKSEWAELLNEIL